MKLNKDQLEEYVEIGLPLRRKELGLMTRTTRGPAQKNRAGQGEERGPGGRHHRAADVAPATPWTMDYLLTALLVGVRLLKHAALYKNAQFEPTVVMMIAALIGKVAADAHHHSQWSQGLAPRRRRWPQ